MWIYRPEDDVFYPHLTKWPDAVDQVKGEIYFDHEDAPTEKQGELFADALNVHEATGLTPSQLQARVAELEAAINRLKIYIVGLPDGLTRDHMLDHVAEALKP